MLRCAREPSLLYFLYALGELLEARFTAAVDNGYGDLDWTAIALEVRAEVGVASE